MKKRTRRSYEERKATALAVKALYETQSEKKPMEFYRNLIGGTRTSNEIIERFLKGDYSVETFMECQRNDASAEEIAERRRTAWEQVVEHIKAIQKIGKEVDGIDYKIKSKSPDYLVDPIFVGPSICPINSIELEIVCNMKMPLAAHR